MNFKTITVGLTTAIDSYTNDQLVISKQAKAMGHPARIAILKMLAKGSFTCNDIVASLPLAQSTISQHLKELKNAELVSAKEMPPKTLYSLNTDNYRRFKHTLENII